MIYDISGDVIYMVRTENIDINYRDDYVYNELRIVMDNYRNGVTNPSFEDFYRYICGNTFGEYIDWKEFSLDELHSVNDDRYPRDYWLSCISRGIVYSKNFDLLVDQVRVAWYSINEGDCVYDSVNRELKLYTFGWSGNEDIILALGRMYKYGISLIYDTPCTYRLVLDKIP